MRILIAVGSDPAALEATNVAQRLFPGAEHVLISAASLAPFVVTEPMGGGLITLGPSSETIATEEDSAHNALRIAQQIVGETTADSVEIGDPGVVICEQAAAHNVDVVVVGRSTKGWFSRVLHPSVSDYVISHAPCAVLVVRETSA